MRRNLSVLIGLLVTATACGGGSESTSDSTSATSGPAPSAPPMAESTSTASENPAGSSARRTVAPPTSTVDDSGSGTGDVMASTSSATVEVVGGELPEEVRTAYLASGGQLVEPDLFETRFGESHLPSVTGTDGEVFLVGATRRLGTWPRDDVTTRLDEAGWLVIDDRPELDQLLDDLAEAAGVDGWAVSVREPNQDSAMCQVRSHTRNDITYDVQGCEYPSLPGLFAVSVSREGPARWELPTVDPSVPVVVAALDDQEVFSLGGEARFDEPNAAGATLSKTFTITFREVPKLKPLVDQLGDVALAGWERHRRGDDAVLFTEPGGGTWTITAGAATYTFAGGLS